jgi:hypothetical protein
MSIAKSVTEAFNANCKLKYKNLITLAKYGENSTGEMKMKKVMIQLFIVSVVVSGYVLPVLAAGGAGF